MSIWSRSFSHYTEMLTCKIQIVKRDIWRHFIRWTDGCSHIQLIVTDHWCVEYYEYRFLKNNWKLLLHLFLISKFEIRRSARFNLPEGRVLPGRRTPRKSSLLLSGETESREEYGTIALAQFILEINVAAITTVQ